MSDESQNNPPSLTEPPKRKFGPPKPGPRRFAGGTLEVNPATTSDPAPTQVPGLNAVIEDQKAYEREEYEQEVDRIRKTRKPFGASLQKLALPLRPNYHRHWFNDTPGRLDEAKAGGWTHVKDEQGKPTRRVVGNGRDKGGLYAYAMEIPSVFWEEDQQAHLQIAKSRVEAIKSSPVQARQGEVKPQDKEKFYTPREISIEKR